VFRGTSLLNRGPNREIKFIQILLYITNLNPILTVIKTKLYYGGSSTTTTLCLVPDHRLLILDDITRARAAATCPYAVIIVCHVHEVPSLRWQTAMPKHSGRSSSWLGLTVAVALDRSQG
jgi:hypothetical protein